MVFNSNMEEFVFSSMLKEKLKRQKMRLRQTEMMILIIESINTHQYKQS